MGAINPGWLFRVAVLGVQVGRTKDIAVLLYEQLVVTLVLKAPGATLRREGEKARSGSAVPNGNMLLCVYAYSRQQSQRGGRKQTARRTPSRLTWDYTVSGSRAGFATFWLTLPDF